MYMYSEGCLTLIFIHNSFPSPSPTFQVQLTLSNMPYVKEVLDSTGFELFTYVLCHLFVPISNNSPNVHIIFIEPSNCPDEALYLHQVRLVVCVALLYTYM